MTDVPELKCPNCGKPKKLAHYPDGSIYASMHVPLTWCEGVSEQPPKVQPIFPKGQFWLEDDNVIDKGTPQ